MKTIAEIRARRQSLLAQAERQRIALSRQYASLQAPANLAARGIAGILWLKQHPLVIAVASALLVAVRPRQALKLVGRGLVAWRALRTIRGFLKASGISA
ncbi:MAG: YqjK-like family protein [Burkholderiales bacterium]